MVVVLTSLSLPGAPREKYLAIPAFSLLPPTRGEERRWKPGRDSEGRSELALRRASALGFGGPQRSWSSEAQGGSPGRFRRPPRVRDCSARDSRFPVVKRGRARLVTTHNPGTPPLPPIPPGGIGFLHQANRDSGDSAGRDCCVPRTLLPRKRTCVCSGTLSIRARDRTGVRGHGAAGRTYVRGRFI